MEWLDDDEDMYTTSIDDRYDARPNNMETMCLVTFAANYEQHSSKWTTDANVCKDINYEENKQGNVWTDKTKIMHHKDDVDEIRKQKEECIIILKLCKSCIRARKVQPFMSLVLPMAFRGWIDA